MTELTYVNVHGQPVHVNSTLYAKPAKKPSSTNSGPTEFFKGYRVIGHPPGALEEARAEHQARQAKKAKPEEFDEEAWLRTARKKPVRSQPYALLDAADTCVQLALKAGWLAVERVAIERRKV